MSPQNSASKIIILIVFTLLSACESHKNPLVTIETDLGTIKVELYEKEAPLTVANFMDYIDKGMFDGGEFYRVVRLNNQPDNSIKIEVIQGGMGWDDSIPRLPAIGHETTKQTGILHKTGVISMARDMPGTASSEFFICMNDAPELDFGGKRNPDGQGFAAFGKVVSGLAIAQKIQNLPDTNQMLVSPLKIISVKRE